MKAYRGSGGVTPHILNLGSEIDLSGQSHDSAALLTGEIPPVAIVGGWAGQADGMDKFEKRQSNFSYRISNPGLPSPYPSRYTLSWFYICNTTDI